MDQEMVEPVRFIMKIIRKTPLIFYIIHHNIKKFYLYNFR